MNDLGFIEKEIKVEGLKKEYRILHVTDFHVVMCDERDADFVIPGECYWRGTKISYLTDFRNDRFVFNGKHTDALFLELCDKLNANPDCADIVVFTGDIIDFYTSAAFEFVRDNLKKLKIPYMYVIGNHDMIFSSMSYDEVRASYQELSGDNVDLQKMKLGELTLVGCYNGDYCYTDKVLGDLKTALDGEENVILFQHVPLPEEDYEKFTSEETRSEVKESYKTVFEWITKPDSQVKAMIAGDSHIDKDYMIGDISSFISPLSSEVAPILFKIHS